MNLSVINIKRIILVRCKKEPWQIAAARYCVEHSEKGFTKAGLIAYLQSSYQAHNLHIEQFWQEEIYQPPGRQRPRDWYRDDGFNYWIPPLDLVAKVTDYDELREARKNAKYAFWLSTIAIIIAIITLYVSARSGENQIEQSQQQAQLQNTIWNYEQMRNDRIEARDIQWRREDLQPQGRFSN